VAGRAIDHEGVRSRFDRALRRANRRADRRQLSTPYRDLLPPLSTEEFDALEADILAHGLQNAIVVDEDGNILDGHNRYAVLRRHRLPLQVRTIEGLTEAERRACVYRSNLARRNLSPSQKRELRKQMQRIARQLRQEGRSQSELATTLGVPRETVRDWIRNIGGSANTSGPDCRVKVHAGGRREIVRRVSRGELQAQIAADYGITSRQVSNIVRREGESSAQEEPAAPSDARANGIIVGDYRIAGRRVQDGTVDLIFCDPVWGTHEKPELVDRNYRDLARFASRVLKPSGWCLAYVGGSFWLQAGMAMKQHLEPGPLFAAVHGGPGALASISRHFNVIAKFKPVLAFFKPPFAAPSKAFSDVVFGKREKGLHEWQQSLVEAEHFIGHLCAPGGLVLDPFCGSGTTCAAAKRIGRRWLAFEIDAKTAAAARARVQRAGRRSGA